ncbi:MAG: hypothetical protein Q9188_004819 [Gyalolechia gomerana]
MYVAKDRLRYDAVFFVDAYRMWITLSLGTLTSVGVLAWSVNWWIQTRYASQKMYPDLFHFTPIVDPTQPAQGGPQRRQTERVQLPKASFLRKQTHSTLTTQNAVPVFPQGGGDEYSADPEADQPVRGSGHTTPPPRSGDSAALQQIQDLLSTFQNAELAHAITMELPVDFAGGACLESIVQLLCSQERSTRFENEQLRDQMQRLSKKLHENQEQAQAHPSTEEADAPPASQSSDFRRRIPRICVLARIRPAELTEQTGTRKLHWTFSQASTHNGLPEHRLELEKEGTQTDKAVRSGPFAFDRIFDAKSTGSDLYGHIKPMIQAALEGRSAVIVVDGQSGAGKSHTLFDGPDAIATCAVDHIFDWVASMTLEGWSCTVDLSSLEIYQQRIQDLLRPSNTDSIEPRLTADGMILPEHVVRPVDSAAQLKDMLRYACGNRSVKATCRNPNSSRGHAITIFTVQRSKRSSVSAAVSQQSKLFLVDLAGGETPGDRSKDHALAKEANAINMGRSHFSTCMKAMVNSENCSSKSRSSKVSKTQTSACDNDR